MCFLLCPKISSFHFFLGGGRETCRFFSSNFYALSEPPMALFRKATLRYILRERDDTITLGYNGNLPQHHPWRTCRALLKKPRALNPTSNLFRGPKHQLHLTKQKKFWQQGSLGHLPTSSLCKVRKNWHWLKHEPNHLQTKRSHVFWWSTLYQTYVSPVTLRTRSTQPRHSLNFHCRARANLTPASMSIRARPWRCWSLCTSAGVAGGLRWGGESCAVCQKRKKTAGLRPTVFWYGFFTFLQHEAQAFYR